MEYGSESLIPFLIRQRLDYLKAAVAERDQQSEAESAGEDSGMAPWAHTRVNYYGQNDPSFQKVEDDGHSRFTARLFIENFIVVVYVGTPSDHLGLIWDRIRRSGSGLNFWCEWETSKMAVEYAGKAHRSCWMNFGSRPPATTEL